MAEITGTKTLFENADLTSYDELNEDITHIVLTRSNADYKIEYNALVKLLNAANPFNVFLEANYNGSNYIINEPSFDINTIIRNNVILRINLKGKNSNPSPSLIINGSQPIPIKTYNGFDISINGFAKPSVELQYDREHNIFIYYGTGEVGTIIDSLTNDEPWGCLRIDHTEGEIDISNYFELSNSITRLEGVKGLHLQTTNEEFAVGDRIRQMTFNSIGEFETNYCPQTYGGYGGFVNMPFVVLSAQPDNVDGNKPSKDKDLELLVEPYVKTGCLQASVRKTMFNKTLTFSSTLGTGVKHDVNAQQHLVEGRTKTIFNFKDGTGSTNNSSLFYGNKIRPEGRAVGRFIRIV